MDASEQLKAFDQIANKAKRAGMLRYARHGVIIITLPDGVSQPSAPSSPPADAPANPAGPASAG